MHCNKTVNVTLVSGFHQHTQSEYFDFHKRIYLICSCNSDPLSLGSWVKSLCMAWN